MRIQPLETAFCILYLLLILYSCGERNRSVELLQKARQMAENNPTEALQLLDSISDPEGMSTDNYMQYIVAKVQTKYKTYQDITNDTLIFEACKYLDNTSNTTQSALAHYYAASVNHEKKLFYNSLEHFLLAQYYAKKSGHNLLTAKSQHSIGNLYFDKNLMDSSILSYKRALNHYKKEKGTELHQLEVMRSMGNTYETLGNLDSAYYYLNEGLQSAKLLNNTKYQITFTHLLGIVFWRQKGFSKAADYFQKAFAETENKEESHRICLNLLKLYNEKNQLDSAGYYAGLLKESLPQITYPYTLQESYESLSDYYEKVGDYRNAFYYNSLLSDINKEIYESNNLKQLSDTHQQYNSVLEKKEAERLQMRNNLLLACTVLVIILVVAIAYFRIKRIRQKSTEKSRLLEARLETKRVKLQAQEENVEQRNKSLGYMQSTYENIIHEWGEIDKRVKALAAEYGATEEPELYVQIKSLIGNFKENTNLHLIALAKDYLQKQPYGEAALNTLQDRELLVFMLYYSGYKRKEVAVLLGVDPSKANMNIRKIGLRTKLLKVGMPKDEVEQILFSEDNKEGEEPA